jgi:hypothetical protein
MATMNDLEILTLEAFLAALAKQSAPLPHEIQQRLQAIGENLEQHIDELIDLAEAHPPLYVAYQSERSTLQSQGGQRQKRLTANNTIERTGSLTRVAKTILRSDNSVLTTQDFFRLATDHPELVLSPSNGSPDEVSKAASNTSTTATSPINASASSSPTQSTSPGIQRIVLAANASDRDRKNYQQYLEELKRLNPDWAIIPDRPQPDETDAYLIVYQDQNYAARHAAYIATRYLNDFCRNLKL